MGMFWLFVGFVFGTFNGVITMCLFQINQEDKKEIEGK